jgi:hypothetical protein
MSVGTINPRMTMGSPARLTQARMKAVGNNPLDAT